MITLLTGKKGSGKTKRLISLIHEAVGETKGHVVCIEKGDTLTYGVDHNARLINLEDYSVSGFDGLYSFLSGLCAGNYDITDILVDSTLKIAGGDVDNLKDFVKEVKELSDKANVNMTFSISADSSEFPSEIAELASVQ